MNLFETYTGADFLAFYGVMLVTCVGLSFWLPAFLRQEGRLREVDDPEDLAVLSGGPKRFATAILADLFAQGAIARSDKSRANVARTSIDTGEAGKAVLRKVGPFNLKEATATLNDHAGRIQNQLQRRGLLLGNSDWLTLRLMAIAPFAALFALGLYRQQAGSAQGEPTGFLVALLALTAAGAVVRFLTIGQRTRAGQQVLDNWVARSSRLRRAPDASEVKLAVGLFGTGVLVGTPFAHVHAMRQASMTGDGSSRSGDGVDGDAGGCGGGCGGCGG